MTFPTAPLRRLVQTESVGTPPIKGTVSDEYEAGLFPGYSASGQDVWLPPALAPFTGPGLVVSAVGARCGKVFLADGRWGVTANASVLRPRSGVEPRFAWYLTNDEFFWERGTTAQPYVQMDASLSKDGPMPPPELQRRIADFLDDQVARIDNIIALRSQQRTLLTEESAVRGRQIVAGNFDGSTSRPSTVPWIARLGTEAHEIPLARIVTLQRGVDLTSNEHRDGEIPVVTTAGVAGHHDTAIVCTPGVVIGRYGTVGNVHWIDRPHWPHNTTLYVRDCHGNHPKWCYYLLKSYPYEMLQARAAVPGVNRNDMAPDLMPWIPSQTQRAAARLLDQQAEETTMWLAHLQRSKALLAELRSSLITAAVTGEFDVSSADGSQVPVA